MVLSAKLSRAGFIFDISEKRTLFFQRGCCHKLGKKLLYFCRRVYFHGQPFLPEQQTAFNSRVRPHCTVHALRMALSSSYLSALCHMVFYAVLPKIQKTKNIIKQHSAQICAQNFPKDCHSRILTECLFFIILKISRAMPN